MRGLEKVREPSEKELALREKWRLNRRRERIRTPPGRHEAERREAREIEVEERRRANDVAIDKLKGLCNVSALLLTLTGLAILASLIGV
jgi:hypothetical protein